MPVPRVQMGVALPALARLTAVRKRSRRIEFHFIQETNESCDTGCILDMTRKSLGR
jgi:hypothetical protein